MTLPDAMVALLPDQVAVVEAYQDVPDEAPFPGEEHLVARAVAARRREIITARRCARQALGRLGLAPTPILAGPRREPLWPDGVVGSITHCAGYRAAAVARRSQLASIGVDAEPHAALPDGVLGSVSLAPERAVLRDLATTRPDVHWDRVLFSAKESVYKAWYPLTGRWLGFDEAQLRLNPSDGTFTARLLVPGDRTDGQRPLTHLRGRHQVVRRLVVTAVTVPA